MGFRPVVLANSVPNAPDTPIVSTVFATIEASPAPAMTVLKLVPVRNALRDTAEMADVPRSLEQLSVKLVPATQTVSRPSPTAKRRRPAPVCRDPRRLAVAPEPFAIRRTALLQDHRQSALPVRISWRSRWIPVDQSD